MDWYLVRTKTGKERWVRDQLTPQLPEVFLPLLEASTPRWGKLAWTVAPLFPGYLFARLDPGNSTCDFAGDEGFSPSRTFMVEENTVHGKQRIRFPIVHRHPVGV